MWALEEMRCGEFSVLIMKFEALYCSQTTSSDQMDCNGANSNRSGLFRTPISGGVQSATSSHNLPAPAVAVRNLIEQVLL